MTASAAADPGELDAVAVRSVVAALRDVERESDGIQIALATMREAFGWDYASFWRVDESDDVLRFGEESGSVDAAFREVTRSATFAPGVGLAGRTWREGGLVFVEDLADVRDCVRAPAARAAGVRSGVCLPIRIAGRVVGTMDFFTRQTEPVKSPV